MSIKDLPAWPECVKCGEEFDPRREALGYKTCLGCAEPKKEYCSVPMHKGNLVLVTDKEQLKYIGVQTPREGGTS